MTPARLVGLTVSRQARQTGTLAMPGPPTSAGHSTTTLPGLRGAPATRDLVQEEEELMPGMWK